MEDHRETPPKVKQVFDPNTGQWVVVGTGNAKETSAPPKVYTGQYL